jgi:2-amino-4-hydroxy-6-hydroxymethyldihydropteridine diphosphokinase
MNDLYIQLGSNLGDRSLNIANAIELIAAACGPVIKESACYETAPWGVANQGMFLNKVIMLQCAIPAFDLLNEFHTIERFLGRKRNGTPNEARTVDIDILFYGDNIITSDVLTIPHPRIHLRRFVLVPMNEIAPELVHPVVGLSIKSLLDSCPDNLDVNIYEAVANFS